MPRRDIEVAVVGTSDFGRARRDAASDLNRIESDAKDTAEDIERAFDRIELSPELDTSDIRQALSLADQLDGMVAELTLDTDLDDIKQAEKIARSLRAFQGRVDLSVEGREDLKDALDLASKMDQIREVKVQVQGQEDLKRAAGLAEDLDQTRRVRVDVDDSDIKGLGDQIAAEGEAGAEGITDAIGGIDFDNLGGEALSQFTGALTAAGPLGAAAASLGLVFGDDFIGGFSRALNSERTSVIRSITSGLDEADMAVAGQAAGDTYAAGFGESLPQVQADADRLIAILGDIVDEADFGELTKQSQLLSEVLGVEVPEAATLARRAVTQGLADDVQDAFDDMTAIVGEFGDTGLEALDIFQEFGPNFARFEVDGGRAARFVAAAFEDGLVPTIDRAGEAFEEFTTRIVDSDSADAIADLGLNFEKIQDDIARGGPPAAAAMQSVVQALLDENDAAEQARLTNIIFGASFEQVNDKAELLDRILGLLADNTDLAAGKTKEATAALEGSVTAWQLLAREVEGAGVQLGQFVQWLDETAQLDLNAPFDVGSSIRDFIFGTDEATDAVDDLADSTKGAAGEEHSFGLEAEYMAEALGEAETSASDLRAELDALFGFEPDRLMRQIADAADDLTESMTAVDNSAIGLNGSIDITTDEGRRLQSQLEGLNGTLVDARVAFDNNEISAYEMATAQAAAEAAIRKAGEAAGLSTGQIQALINKYLEAAGLDPIKITVDYDGSFAENELRRFKALVDSVPRTITTTTVNRTGSSSSGRSSSSSTRTASGSSIRRFASGGVVAEPEIAIVGDNPGARTDPEIITPQSLMERTLISALRKADLGGGRRGVNIENLNVTDGRSIWRELDEMQAVMVAAG